MPVSLYLLNKRLAKAREQEKVRMSRLPVRASTSAKQCPVASKVPQEAHLHPADKGSEATAPMATAADLRMILEENNHAGEEAE